MPGTLTFCELLEYFAMLIGYARVSTDDQNLDLQRDALKAAGCERMFEDKASGGKAERPALAALIDILRAGDTVVVWRLNYGDSAIKSSELR
jgi:DNA invertase Pin-like site-specific DNA recombinase